MIPPPPEEVWSLPTRHLGQRVHLHGCVDSTNTLALALGHDPAWDGLVLLAREQTAGRGQYGRSWQAPPGSSVLLSVLLFPPPRLRRPALLTAWAAVSVCATIGQLAGLPATIKWPNDILVHGKKVCGILIEQRTTPHADFPLATVLGLGLNLLQPAARFEEAGLPLAGSLLSLSGHAFAHEPVARELILQLDQQYQGLIEDRTLPLETSWKEKLGLLGQTVLVEGVAQELRGRLLDVSLQEVTLEIKPGEIVRLAPEAIRHLHRDPLARPVQE